MLKHIHTHKTQCTCNIKNLHLHHFLFVDLVVLLSVGRTKFCSWHTSHFCQVKSCKLVCGESLCEVKIACFCNKFWVLLPFLTLLDSPVVEWEIAWLIMCIWKEIQSSCKGLILFLLYRGVLLMCDLLCSVLYVSGGWYSSCSDTRSLFTQHPTMEHQPPGLSKCPRQALHTSGWQARATLKKPKPWPSDLCVELPSNTILDLITLN